MLETHFLSLLVSNSKTYIRRFDKATKRRLESDRLLKMDPLLLIGVGSLLIIVLLFTFLLTRSKKTGEYRAICIMKFFMLCRLSVCIKIVFPSVATLRAIMRLCVISAKDEFAEVATSCLAHYNFTIAS